MRFQVVLLMALLIARDAVAALPASADLPTLAPMLEQMDAFERGGKLKNLVDRKAGY